MINYRNLFKKLPLPCLLFEKKNDVFVILEANTYYCTLTNRKGDEWKGKIIEDVFPENPLSMGLKEIKDSFNIAYNTQEPHKIDILRYDLFNEEAGIFEIKFWEIENIPVSENPEGEGYILNVVKDITADILERDRCKSLQGKLDSKTEHSELIIERITDGLFSLDLEGRFVSLNKGLVDIAEIPETDILGMNFLPFCGEEHLDKIMQHFNAAVGGENQKYEANFISGKGRNMVLEISLVPLKDEGIITGLYGIAKDITRLKAYEDALLKSERKFKALVQEGSDLIGILDLKGRYKFVSETSTSVLGIAPQDLIGKKAFDFIHPEDINRVITEFSILEEKNQIEIQPFRFRNGQDEWRWVETKATNLISDPAVKGVVTNSRDVTNHIRSQKAIKESEERYRSFFENSPDAIMVTIPDGNILAANPSACNMFQRSEAELCSLGRAGVTEPLDPQLLNAVNLRKEKGTVSVELTFFRKDGTKFPGELTSSIFRDSEGNARSSMIIRDITERKIAQNKLLELNKSLKANTLELVRAIKGLEQFSYIISHNLRAPVANIMGLANLLNEKGYSKDIRKNLRKEIKSNASRMDLVIKDLNQVLQVKQDFTEIKQSIDLNEVVESIKISLHDLIKKENISIITNFREIDQIKSIRSFIHSIFYNLIFNSIKFRQPGVDAVISITSKEENGMVCFIFEDNGLGMDLVKKKDEIFGLYKRFHFHVEGKGMGLFMVKTQVEMLGGKISLASKVDHGSTFTIQFKNQNLMK